MAAAAPASCTVIPAGEAARRSPNSSVPSRTPDTGSTVSITGRLAARAPAWKALADSSSPAVPSTSRAQGCQWASAAPGPAARSSRVRLSVTAAVRPNTAPAAVAVMAARTGPVASLPTASASVQTTPTTAKASSQSRAGAPDRARRRRRRGQERGDPAGREHAAEPVPGTQRPGPPCRHRQREQQVGRHDRGDQCERAERQRQGLQAIGEGGQRDAGQPERPGRQGGQQPDPARLRRQPGPAGAAARRPRRTTRRRPAPRAPRSRSLRCRSRGGPGPVPLRAPQGTAPPGAGPAHIQPGADGTERGAEHDPRGQHDQVTSGHCRRPLSSCYWPPANGTAMPGG